MTKHLRSILIALIALAVVCVAAYAYIALTSEVRLSIDEPLSFVGSNNVDVNLYPQESVDATFTIANASSVDLDVDLTYTVTPDLGGKGITVDVPNSITAPASGQVDATVTISASKSAVPGSYTITVNFAR